MEQGSRTIVLLMLVWDVEKGAYAMLRSAHDAKCKTINSMRLN